MNNVKFTFIVFYFTIRLIVTVRIRTFATALDIVTVATLRLVNLTFVNFYTSALTKMDKFPILAYASANKTQQKPIQLRN